MDCDAPCAINADIEAIATHNRKMRFISLCFTYFCIFAIINAEKNTILYYYEKNLTIKNIQDKTIFVHTAKSTYLFSAKSYGYRPK